MVHETIFFFGYDSGTGAGGGALIFVLKEGLPLG